MPATFWAHVDKSAGADACWPWNGARTRNGYGRYSAKMMPTNIAHRIAWILTNGEVGDGLDVCHHCDNRPCCNPGHLFLGTRADNMADASRKGRLQMRPELVRRGAAGNGARLTDAQVLSIHARLRAGEQKSVLARELGVSETAIRYVQIGRTWKHLHPLFSIRAAP